MIYRKKIPTIEAEQYDGSRASADKLSRMYASNVFPEFSGPRWADFTGRLVISTTHGREFVSPTDWIVSHCDGTRRAVSDALFHEEYEPHTLMPAALVFLVQLLRRRSQGATVMLLPPLSVLIAFLASVAATAIHFASGKEPRFPRWVPLLLYGFVLLLAAAWLSANIGLLR